MLRRGFCRTTLQLAHFIPMAMPALSPSMEVGIVSQWLKKKGDKVESGDVIAKVSTDKATVDFVHQGDEGFLANIFLKEGESVSVGTVIAVMVEDAAELPQAGEYVPPQAAAPSAAEVPKPTASSESKLAPTEGVAWPNYASKLMMPALSPSMTEGTIHAWLKKVGDKIESNDVIASVTTDKANVDFVHQGDEGFIGKIFVQQGVPVPVGSVIAVIVEEASQVASAATLSPPTAVLATAATTAKPAPTVAPSPRAPTAPVNATSEALRARLVRSGPAAIVLGSALSDDVLRNVVPTGKDGRFTKADLMPFASNATQSEPSSSSSSASPKPVPSGATPTRRESSKILPGLVVDFSVTDSLTLNKMFRKA